MQVWTAGTWPHTCAEPAFGRPCPGMTGSQLPRPLLLLVLMLLSGNFSSLSSAQVRTGKEEARLPGSWLRDTWPHGPATHLASGLLPQAALVVLPSSRLPPNKKGRSSQKQGGAPPCLQPPAPAPRLPVPPSQRELSQPEASGASIPRPRFYCKPRCLVASRHRRSEDPSAMLGGWGVGGRHEASLPGHLCYLWLPGDILGT